MMKNLSVTVTVLVMVVILSSSHRFVSPTAHSDCGLGFTLVTENGCVCPRQTLTLECNVIGAGMIVLTYQEGSPTCMGLSSELTLLHSRYNATGGDSGSIPCSKGTIVGRILRVEKDCFTAQVQVKFSDDMIGNVISCEYDNGTSTMLVGHYLLPSIDPLPPPSDISWTRIDAEDLMFSWSPVISNCLSIHYEILHSHCGVCPDSTTDINITCTNTSTNPLTMCTFAVQTVVCGNISGEWSSQVLVKDNDAHSFSARVVIAVTTCLSCVVLLLGTGLVIFGVTCTKKWKLKQQTSIYISAPVQNSPQSDRSQAMLSCQPKPMFHCDQTYDERGYTLCQSDYDQITVSNNNYSRLDRTQSQNVESRSNAIFRDLHSNDTQSIITGCVRIEDESLNLESLLAKLQGRVSRQWFQFGLAIGVPRGILDQLKYYPVEQCLVELLDYWLKYHPDQPTWKELADAIEDIQDYELASSILKIYEK